MRWDWPVSPLLARESSGKLPDVRGDAPCEPGAAVNTSSTIVG
jgi:hypothetical protein